MLRLTIGIPTYNSYDYLKETIDKVLEQIQFIDGIELLICDNASDDGTDTLAEQYIHKFPNLIRYVRHQSNLGMDRNFWSVIKYANGEFVHLLSDDDYYTKNGVKRILDVITNHNVDAVLLSNNYLNTINGKFIQNSESCKEDILCKADGAKFFLQESLKMLCLSNVVVKKSKCTEITNIEKYFGCQWLHLAVLTQIIKPSSSTYIFNYKEPVVTVRMGNQKWLEKDGAIVYFYKALNVFYELKNSDYGDGVFAHIRKIYLPILLNGGRLNFKRIHMNVYFCFKFLKFYYDMPKQYILFCLKLLLMKHRPFFEGWEKLGGESESAAP